MGADGKWIFFELQNVKTISVTAIVTHERKFICLLMILYCIILTI